MVSHSLPKPLAKAMKTEDPGNEEARVRPPWGISLVPTVGHLPVYLKKKKGKKLIINK